MKKIVLLVVITIGLAGCRYADVPAPVRFASEPQYKLQAAQHWQLIAGHFADQLAQELAGKAQGKALYIPVPEGEQAFVSGFRELLITELVLKGVPMATEQNGALLADVRYSAYRFRPERLANTYHYGTATALAAGLWAVGGILASGGASAPGVNAGSKLLATTVAAEGFAWASNTRYASGGVPQSEILLTVSIEDGKRIMSRHSSIYYAADEDIGLYWQRAASQPLKVMGDCGAGGVKCTY